MSENKETQQKATATILLKEKLVTKTLHYSLIALMMFVAFRNLPLLIDLIISFFSK